MKGNNFKNEFRNNKIMHRMRTINSDKNLINNFAFSPNKKEKKNVSDKNLQKIEDKNKIRYSPVYEVLGIKNKDKKNYDRISSEFKNYEKEFNINISFSNKKNLKFDSPIETSKIIDILSLPPEKRTFDDIFFMKKYLLSTKIENLFKDEFNNKEESIDKLLTFFGLEMKYRLFREDEIVFRIGDLSVFLFLIIEGKVEILKPINEIKEMTGYEYYSYLLDLKNNNEEYLFNLSIDENLKAFDIDKNDFEQLSTIYILNLLEKIKLVQNINFEEEFDFVNIDPEDLDLDPSKLKSNEYIFLRLKQIKDKLPVISPEKVKKYKFIVDHEEKKQVKIYKYLPFLKLDKNYFFGESAMGDNERRNATIKIVEDSYLGYLSASLYKTNFFAEKKLVTESKINFLHSRFFFNKIALKRFAKKYFNLFISESFINGNIIYNESDPINYVYFIEEGNIELSSSKTILEIEIFLQGLEKKISLNDETAQLKYKNISSNTDDLKEYLNKTQKNRILLTGKYEILGLESFYYNIPYFTTSKVISSRAKVFKIDSKQLWQILNIEVDCLPDLKYLVLNKTKIFKKRFFGINNTKLTLIDEKINVEYEREYLKNLENKKKMKENESIKTQKNNLNYNEIQIKTIFQPRTKRNNPLSHREDLSSGKKDKKKKKIINYFSMFENIDIDNSFGLNRLNKSSEDDLGTYALQNEIENNNKKNTFLEDKLLNKIKNQIKLLNSNKYFFSRIKLSSRKSKSIDNDNKENNDKKNIEEENPKKLNDNLDLSNSKDENNNLNKQNKGEFFDTQIKFKNKNENYNNSTETILPSIFSARPNHKKIFHRSLSYIYNNKNNYSCSLNINSDKSYYKNSFSPNNQQSKFFSFLSEKNNKNLCNKKFIGLNIKKFANFYEIKNNYQKEKFRFYNDSEFFGYKKKEDLKTFELKNLNQLNNGIKPIKFFNPKLQIINKEIISKIKKHNNFNKNDNIK